jgi:amidase
VDDELCFASARELAAMLREGKVSAREVTRAHLERIAAVNPEINAVVTLTADLALARAAEADRRHAAREPLGPLHGLPVAHKDSRLTKGVRTTFGSPIFKDHVPEIDDLVVQRIAAAGAIMMGKTNLPEFGAGSHTFNPLFGPTRNPYDPTTSAGGSSGGSAAGLAAGMFALADGSDMGGSLRNPASFCNVVGLRPSPGLVPEFPGTTSWAPLGVSGPLARSMSDLSLLLSVLAGPDPRVPLSVQRSGRAYAEPPPSGVAGLRVAWSPDLGGAVPVDPVVIAALAPAPRVFEDLGCEVTQDCPSFAGADEAFLTLRAWEFELGLGPLLDSHRDELKPWVAWNIEQGRALRGSDVGRAERLRTELFVRMHEFFERYDVLLLPVSQVVPFPVEHEYPAIVAGQQMPTYLDWMRSCYYVSVTSCPALSVPAGFTANGLPVGLQIVGRHLDEATVLRAGLAFERATGYGTRRPGLTGPPARVSGSAGPGSGPAGPGIGTRRPGYRAEIFVPLTNGH